MLRPDYPIATDRLLLRPLDAQTDADAVHAYSSRADVCRYIPYEPRSRDEIAAWLATHRNQTTLKEEGQALGLAVTLRSAGTLIGDVILMWRSAEHSYGEIGYVFHPDHAGHGYATESARAVLGLAFDGLGLHRVIARVDARNAPSINVLRRIGMRQEAHLVQNEWFKGEWTDELDFAMLDSEWRRAELNLAADDAPPGLGNDIGQRM